MSHVLIILAWRPIVVCLGLVLACCAPRADAVEPAFTYAYDQVFIDGPIPPWEMGESNVDGYTEYTNFSSVYYSPDGMNGATTTDAFQWVTSPASPTGQPAHQTRLLSGWHQQFWYYTVPEIYSQWVYVDPNTAPQSFYTYVYLDPANPPTAMVLNWDMTYFGADTWAHQAYWGPSAFAGDSTALHYMGAMPAAGQWVRLEVPLASLGVTGFMQVEGYSVVDGMAYTILDGRATFGASGVDHSAVVQPEPVPFYQYVLPQGQWDVFYTSNFAELGGGEDGYQFQGPVCSIESNPSIATIQLRRYFQPATGHHCYATFHNDGAPLYDDAAHAFDPWTYEGVAGFLYVSQVPGTVPLYRFFNSYVPIHAYSTSADLGDGWTFQCLEGYVFPAMAGNG